MSEGTADVLTAQFTSIRVNVADLLNVQKEFNASFDTVKTDISMIRENTAAIKDIKVTLDDMKRNGVKAL